MKSIIYSSLFCTLFTSVAFAASTGHHEPSIWDLKYPFVNFVIMLAILSKVVKPLREKFNKNAEDVKTLMESAEVKAKDAQDRLNQYQSKVNNLDGEIAKIVSEYELETSQFAHKQSEETQTTIVRMKRDLENKLEGEKKELLDELNQDLLNKVIASTQSAIKNNNDFKAKATQKIISELR